jgi:hypothetical protein
MSRSTVEVLKDDLTGEEDPTIQEVIFLGIDGRTVYGIDLGEVSREQYGKLIGEYQEKAEVRGVLGEIRPVPKPRAPKSGTKAKATASGTSNTAKAGGRPDRAHTAQVREWARANGWPDLGDKGRIPAEATEAYRKAHDGEKASA